MKRYNLYMVNNIKIEICLGNIQDVETLNNYPIDRIELNSALELGGLTPSINTVIEAKKISNKPIVCMCRCRGGNFIYTEKEYDVMFKDARNMLENGADGIVFGFLNEDYSINVNKTKMMVELIKSYDKEVIFHKAFDESDDLRKSCEVLSGLGVDRILTGGGTSSNIMDGCSLINELHNEYPIELLPGGGVRVNNVKDVIKGYGTGQVHMTSKKTCPGGYVGLDEVQLQEMIMQIENL